jgi:hypothetical protein
MADAIEIRTHSGLSFTPARRGRADETVTGALRVLKVHTSQENEY